LVSRYEEIRLNIVCADGIGAGECQGLSLILHKGLTAWIRAWSCMSYSTARESEAKPAPAARRTKDDSVTAQIISIITTMALHTQKETYA